MKRQVIAEISIIPVGSAETGLSRYIASCLEVMRERQDVVYQLTAMGTVIQGPLDTVLEVARKMHEVPFKKGISRVVTILKIDDRRDKPTTIASKVESVLQSDRSV